MTCSRWEKMIALHAGGDLEASGARRVEKHIAGCRSCRDLADGLAADRTTLAQLDAKASEDINLGSVRGAVAASIGTRGPVVIPFLSGPRLALAAALVVVIAVSAIVLLKTEPRGIQVTVTSPEIADQVVPRAPDVSEGEPEVAVSPTPDVPAEAAPAPGPKPFTRVARAVPPAARPTVVSPSVPSEPILMKILTDDPEVVIYWIVDTKGEEKHV